MATNQFSSPTGLGSSTNYSQYGDLPLRVYMQNAGYGVNWNQNTGQATLTGPNGQTSTITPDYVSNGTAYVSPGTLAPYFLPSKDQENIDQGQLAGWAQVMKSTYGPVFDAQMNALNQRVTQAEDYAKGQDQQISADYNAAKTNLGNQETKDQQRARNSAISRGVYSSGMYGNDLNTISQNYAPYFSNLENQQAAQLATTGEQATATVQNLIAQQQEEAAQYKSDVMQGSLGYYQNEKSQQASDRNTWLNYFTNLASTQATAAQNQQQLEYNYWKAGLPYELQTADAQAADAIKQQQVDDLSNYHNNMIDVLNARLAVQAAPEIYKEETNNATQQALSYLGQFDNPQYVSQALEDMGPSWEAHGVNMDALYKAIIDRYGSAWTGSVGTYNTGTGY